MTQGPNRLFDDFAKLMTDAAGVAQGARREVETAMRAQFERFMSDMDIVTREDHEAVKEMAVKALDQIEALETRIEALEAKLAEAEKKPARKASTRSAKPAAKKDGEE